MEHHPTGGQDEGILIVRQLRRLQELDGVEAAQPPAELVLVQVGCAGVVGSGNRPLEEAFLLQSLVGGPAVDGGHLGDLVQHLFRRGEVEAGGAHPLSQQADDLPIRLRFSQRLDRLAHSLNAPVGSCEGAIPLDERSPRQDDMSQLGRLGEEDVLYHEEVQLFQAVADVVYIGVGEHGVFSHDVEGARAAFAGPIYHVSHRHPQLVGEILHPPGRLELGFRLRRCHLLVAGIDVWQPAQVAGPLDVVLPSQGVDSASRHAHVAGEHGQVGAGLHIVGAGGMLGNAHRVEEGGGLALGIQPRRRPQVVGGNPGDLFHPLRGVLRHRLAELIVSLGPRLEEFPVFQPLSDDDVHQAIKPGHVGAGSGL